MGDSVEFSEHELDHALSMAKVSFMSNRATAFLSNICCSLHTHFDEDIPTACTDGTSIAFNPHFFMSLPLPQRVFLLAHETSHVLYSHMLRRGDRDPYLWNCAGDFMINAELIDQGFEFIPIGLYDAKYAGMNTEQIYELIKGNPQGSLPNGLGEDLKEPEDLDEETIEEAENKIRDIVIRSSQLADMRNDAASVPDSVRRMIAYMAKPKVNWRTQTRRFFQALDKSDYSYRRPNRRFEDVYLPTRRGKKLSKISFAIDTSGSVTKKQFNQFIGEVAGLLRSAKPKELELMQFDHALQSVEIVKSVFDLTQVEFKGHGGTNPAVALNHFIDSDSKALFVLTDGYFSPFDLPKPARPVVWVIFNNEDFVAPFGKAIHIKI